MRKWGILISVLYALIVLGLLVPVGVSLVGPSDWWGVGPADWWGDFLTGLIATYSEWLLWILIAIVIGGQALLLFLSVDTSQKRLKPRSHILLSVSVAALLTALLTVAVIGSIGVAARGDKFLEKSSVNPFVVFGVLWIFWGILFCLFLRNSSAVATRITTWLLRGSILELIVAVSCHVIVRRRHQCSAPAVTSFGVVTGIAIMLLCFGPSVLFLYKKRIDAYPPRSSP